MFGRKQDEAEDAPFWKQRSWVFSAVFLATMLAVAAMAYVTGDSGDGDDAAASAAERKAQNGPLATQGSKGGGKAEDERPEGCRTDDEKAQSPEATRSADGSESPDARAGGSSPDSGKKPGAERSTPDTTGTANPALPNSAPQDLAWKPLEGVSVPTSPSAGPTHYNGPVWWCYARTPMGAVMAAHGILTHMGTADWRDVAEQQIIAGNGREEFISQRSSVSDPAEQSQEAGVYSGFSVQSYSKSAAEVRILVKDAGGALGATTVSMRWNGGDWKVKPRADGSLYTSSALSSGSDGYVKWGAA